MSGNHLVGAHRNHVAVMVDLMHDQAQPVQLCEVLGLYHKLFTIQVDRLSCLPAPLNQDLLMLTSEK